MGKTVKEFDWRETHLVSLDLVDRFLPIKLFDRLAHLCLLLVPLGYRYHLERNKKEAEMGKTVKEFDWEEAVNKVERYAEAEGSASGTGKDRHKRAVTNDDGRGGCATS
jgi:hypothetical protein